MVSRMMFMEEITEEWPDINERVLKGLHKTGQEVTLDIVVPDDELEKRTRSMADMRAWIKLAAQLYQKELASTLALRMAEKRGEVDRQMDAKEVGALLKRDARTIRMWFEMGKLKGHKVGKKWQMWRSDFMEYCEKCEYAEGLDDI